MFDFAIRIRISDQTISSDFRAIALSTYHRYECKIMDFLIASGMSIVCFKLANCLCFAPIPMITDHHTDRDIGLFTPRGRKLFQTEILKVHMSS